MLATYKKSATQAINPIFPPVAPKVSQPQPRPNTAIPYPVYRQHTIPMPAGQLQLAGWREFLKTYPEQAVLVESILGICRFGARIGYLGPRGPMQIHQNLSCAEDAPDTVTADIKAKLDNNRLECYPSIESLPEYFMASPLGHIDKSNGTKRRIHHLSFPNDEQASGSINGGIPEDYGTITYSGVQDAIMAIQKVGRSCLLVKRDFESAFRHMPISPFDSGLLGFHWETKYYSERFLPFGLRTTPFLFNLFAETFHWILANELAKDHLSAEIIHYHDDFLIILPSHQNPVTYCSKFATICLAVGLRIKTAKNEEGMVVGFGGIELDTENMAIRLPIPKLAEARMIVESATSLTSLSLLDLQRITGYMNFVTVVVPLGRAFLHRLYNIELYFPWKEGRGRQFRLRISKEARLDLK